ncbi:MAG: hypothetical protein VB119_11065 [Candidatus Metalachnospira sp.]|nr:hypothetical protein [Candidatus Metalachnospira sp.]
MRITFIAALIIYYALDFFILIRLFAKKSLINFKHNFTDFLASSALLLIIYYFKIRVPYVVLIFYIMALLINSLFGYYLDYFNKSKYFDRYLHGYSSFAFSLLFYFIIIRFISSGGSKIFQALFISFLGITIGVIFEIFEFLNDIKQNNPKTQRSLMQKSLNDTDFDLIFNIIGSVSGAVFAYFIYL